MAVADIDSFVQQHPVTIQSFQRTPQQPKQPLFYKQENPVETKSARLQLLVRPSILDKLKMVAKTKNTSVNELANVIFETFLK